MRDFWLPAGITCSTRRQRLLLVGDEFLKAYLARPELAPPEEACTAERTLHAALIEDPRRPVAPGKSARIGDRDARETWRVMLSFRDRRLRHAPSRRPTRSGPDGVGDTPPMFINQLCGDPAQSARPLRGPVRAAAAGAVLSPATVGSAWRLADCGRRGDDRRDTSQPVSPLVAMLGLPTASKIEVLDDDNAETYRTAATASTWRWISPRGGAGLRRSAR